METSLVWIGRLAGLAGVALCAVSGLMRVGGNYYLGSYELFTLLEAGMAGMLIGCFCFLVALTTRLKPGS